MSLSVGIVGLPNVGKSTLFNALTSAGAQSANYPFCTIDPNVGIVPVPDPRLERIRTHIASEKVIPATVEIVDIAGLVRGASKGEGLGNKFLANIRETHAVLMVVRCFDDENIVHVDGTVDPIRDIETIGLELIYADIEALEKRIKKAQGAAKTGNVEARAELAFIERLLGHLTEARPVRMLTFSEAETAMLKTMHLLTAKPILYCCNVDEGDLPDGNAHSAKVASYARGEGSECVLVCARIEEELADVDASEKQELLQAYGLEEPALNVLIRSCYDLLGLQSYFTAGPKEIRAWTIRKGDSAPRAAAAIHTDFERGFIRANVYSLEDLEAHGSEAALKSAGKLRSEGKEYIVRDGDIMHFLFNV